MTWRTLFVGLALAVYLLAFHWMGLPEQNPWLWYIGTFVQGMACASIAIEWERYHRNRNDPE